MDVEELRATLLNMAQKWLFLAEEAKAQAGSDDTDTQPAYYFGIAFGLQAAAEELQALIGPPEQGQP